MPKINIGDEIGDLKILSEAGNNSANLRLVLCECKCGNQFETVAYRIKKLKHPQCISCSYKNRSKNNNSKWTGCSDISGKKWAAIKRSAEVRKIDFLITIENAWEIFLKQDKKCALSGVTLTFDKLNTTASLDRIDSSKGYTIDNVQWVHKIVNNMKWNFEQQDFVSFCELISESKKLKKYLTYDDVSILPRYSEITSRKYCNTSSYIFKDISINIPIISAPMSSLSELDMALSLYNSGAIACIHRFSNITEQINLIENFIKETNQSPANKIIMSIGTKDDYYERVQEFVKLGCNLFCIDTAHGNTIQVRDTIKKIKENFDVKIMAGNIATTEGAKNLINWGADSLRVGIGGGAVCSTRIQTGVGLPMITCLQEVSSIANYHSVPVIADGGMRTSGDIAKALACGASGVMLGSMLSGTSESPGEIEIIDNKKYKKYYGSASAEAKSLRGESGHVEGASALIPYKGSVVNVIKDIQDGLRSSMSYTGSIDIPSFHQNAELIEITTAGVIEAHPHLTL